MEASANGRRGSATLFFPSAGIAAVMSSDDPKKDLRRSAMAARRLLCQMAGPHAGAALRDNFTAAFVPPPEAIVAGYWPMSGEIDLQPLLHHLHAADVPVALPVVVGPDMPLRFRLWRPDMTLEEGAFGTRHPGADTPEVRPRIVLVPLLAFDERGYRLGYGGGYYDRTLALLRQGEDGARIVAIGVGFAAQQVSAVPHEPHDQRLDWVVTEKGVIRTG